MASELAANATEVATDAAGKAVSSGGFDAGASVLTTLGWLCFLLGIIYLGYWMIKRYAPNGLATGGRGNLRLEDKVMIGNQQSVCVINYQERRFLVGVTGQNIRLLADLDKKHLSDFEEALASSMSDNDE